jgi:Domain of unknown function (DUF4954)
MAKLNPLTKEQIAQLTQNGCSCDSWETVCLAEGTDLKRIQRVHFQGKIEIGAFGTERVTLADGIGRRTGIFRAKLSNVSIGDNCLVSDVAGWISNVNIAQNVVIENVGTIACVGESTFGNGHEVSVLVEGGGRELRITKDTNAQDAYMAVLYRDRKNLVKKLDAMAQKTAESMRSSRATIGTGVRVTNCQEIINVFIGEYATVNGAQSLKDGTIVSSAEAPTVVENGVIAEHFILQQGSSVKDGAMVFSSLIGEGVRIGKQFSCENSVFFANCEGFHSETCSVFAGPYTVTHHRSTLLIGGMFSFYNAGSGTNQSNHMYKLGPLHQGILERGSKTGSSSYLLWPARVGAFTAVIGKHYAHFDTTEFPFSYINEDDGSSTIVPGMNFFTAGTLRDGEKWPARDKRKNAKKLDFISFNVLSPFTGQKMIDGQAKLLELYEKTAKDQQFVTYKGIAIKRLLLKTCSRYYKIALDKYFGDIVLARIAAARPAALAALLSTSEKGENGSSAWADLGGLLCPKSRIDKLTAAIESGAIASSEQEYKAFEAIQAAYDDDEWNWFCVNYRKISGKDLKEEGRDGLLALLDRWREASLKLLNMVIGDISKEFEGEVSTGFGIDGNREADFEAVRGSFTGNKFVVRLNNEIEDIKKKCDSVQTLIKSMKG